MAMCATPTELAGYLQKDLDTYSATQALTLASGDFTAAADTAFVATNVTWSTLIGYTTAVDLPFSPVTAVSAVRVNGVAVTGFTLRKNGLYRSAGFGSWYAFIPNLFEADLTHGYTAATDDVKLAVLEIAGGLYEHPDVTVQSESIDDYRIARYSGTPVYPGRPWREVAADYRGIAVA
jgi:hypothetical protein